MEEKPNYFSIIPANIRYDKDLSPNAKLLYAEITSLCNSKGFCFATDDYFCKLYELSKSSVQRLLVALEQKKYIRRELAYKQGTKEILDRHIYIQDTLCPKIGIGIPKNENTPIPKNEIDNNININNKNNNNITSDTVVITDSDLQDIKNFEEWRAQQPSYKKDYAPVTESKPQDKPIKSYAYCGHVIRLNDKDFKTWKKRYSNLDLEKELSRLDDYYYAHNVDDWFFRVQKELDKRNNHG